VDQLWVAALAVATSTPGTDQTRKATSSTEKSNTKEDRKMLWIPQIIEKYLRVNVVPHCDLNKRQLMDGLFSFYKSLHMKEIYSDFFTNTCDEE
jgi:hypothetical protein